MARALQARGHDVTVVHDEDAYLSWYKDDFSSVFVATNPFLRIPDFPLNSHGDWIPDEVETIAKQRGAETGVSWREISEMCGFSSIARVNRALRLTGSKRIVNELACSSDTEKMLSVCKDEHLFVPDEGCYSPLAQIAIARFLKQLGHEEVIVADHFGTSPRQMNSKNFLLPDGFVPPEIHTQDRSVYLSIYTDCHYFLVCQSEDSVLTANPMDYFEGFFADEKTNDLWGVGDFSGGLNGG